MPSQTLWATNWTEDPNQIYFLIFDHIDSEGDLFEPACFGSVTNHHIAASTGFKVLSSSICTQDGQRYRRIHKAELLYDGER